MALTLPGCAAFWTEREADEAIAQGRMGEGVTLLQELAKRKPGTYRLKYLAARDEASRALLQKARMLRGQGRLEEATSTYKEILDFDPQHAEAQHGLELIARARREEDLLASAESSMQRGDPDAARRALDEVLAENPFQGKAKELRMVMDLDLNRERLAEPALKTALQKPVSLEFRNASVQQVFEVLSQSAGISFIFDKDVNAELRTTLFAKNTTVDDALSLILRTNQLGKKALNDSTLLIFPLTEAKAKQYQDLVTRTFYLGSASPQKMQEMVRAIVSPKSMYVDDALKMLVVRDTLDVIESVERLISAYDLASPEVTLEVEVLEVSSDSLLNVGVQYPDQVKASVFGAAHKAGELTIDEVRDLGRDNFRLYFPDPVAVLNLKQSSGKAKTLANPRIRVSSREKAKVLVGDKVPVITTTTNQSSSASTESVNYLDVGLKLEVQPEVHTNNDVSIAVNLEVSNIVKEIKSTTGLLTYQIGTRNANTMLRLRDGETQVLAGLIKDEQRDSASHLPGLGKLPLIGRLFSNETNTKSRSEIVLLITPHVVRSLATPSAHVLEFASGTENEASVRPLRLSPSARYSNTDKKLMSAPDATPPAKTGKLPAEDATGSGQPTPPAAAEPGEIAPPPAPVAVAPRLDPAIANIKLDMIAPGQIPVGKEFSLAVALTAQSFDHLEFDIVFDQPGIELVRATPMIKATTLDVSQKDQSIHMSVGKMDAGGSATLVMLTLKATQTTGAPTTVVMGGAQAFRGDQIPLLVSTALPRQFLITP